MFGFTIMIKIVNLVCKKKLVRILGRKKFCEYMLCENPKVIFRRIVEQGDFYKLED